MIRIAPPLTRRQQALLSKEERAWHRQVDTRMKELIAAGMDRQDAFDKAWVDCGGLIISLEIEVNDA